MTLSIHFGRPKFSPKQLHNLLRQRLAGRVHAAYLFGSYARTEADSMSDVDLVVVTPTELPFTERFTAFLDVIDAIGAIDLVVYTPSEWNAHGTTAFGTQKLVKVI